MIAEAAAESNESGIGVTWFTYETAYSQNVPSTVAPLACSLEQPRVDNKMEPLELKATTYILRSLCNMLRSSSRCSR